MDWMRDKVVESYGSGGVSGLLAWLDEDPSARG
jgi:hypothetical protein